MTSEAETGRVADRTSGHTLRSLDSRAWTDSYTNLTRLNPAQVDEDPSVWLGGRPPTAAQLATFIHEATHHWCFTSISAQTLATQTLRTRLSLMRTDGSNDFDRQERTAKYLTAKAAFEYCVRPLAEGMALFAEFDIVSRKSILISPMLTSLAEFFPRATPPDLAKLQRMTGQDLSQVPTLLSNLLLMRLDESSVRKKASLLMTPCRRSGSSYVLGYLAVKSLWRTLCRADPRLLNEPDLFLIYLKSFFFDDWGVATAVLDGSGVDEIRSAERALNYFNARLFAIEEVRATDIDEFAAFALADPGERPPEVPGIKVPEAVASAGRRLADELADELIEIQRSGTPEEGQLIGRATQVFRRRAFMNVCSTQIDLIGLSRTERVALWRGTPILTLGIADATDDSLPELGSATLDIVCTVGEGAVFRCAAVLSRDDRVIACVPVQREQVHSEPPEVTREVISRAFIQREALLLEERALSSATSIAVEESWLKVASDHVRAQCAELVGQMYKDLSLKFAASYEALDEAFANMESNGLLHYFPSSRELRSAALMGLASSVAPSKPIVRSIFSAQDLDMDETVKLFRQLYVESGYPPQLLETDESIFTTI